MQLFYGQPSPYSRKVRIAACELGVELKLVPTNAMAWDNEFGNINPINRVPALLLDDGRVFFDSPVICEYLDVTFGPRLFPAAGADRWAALQRQAFGDGIMDTAVPRRHEILRPDAQRSPERLRLYKRSSDQIVAELEKRVDEFPVLDIGTIAIACGLSYLNFRFSEDNWQDAHPRLSDWFEKFASRPSMLATVFG